MSNSANFLYLDRSQDRERVRLEEQINRWAVRLRAEVGRYSYDKGVFSLEFSSPEHALRYRDKWFPDIPDPGLTGSLYLSAARYMEIVTLPDYRTWFDALEVKDRVFHQRSVIHEGERCTELLFRSAEAATLFKLRWF